MDKQVPSNMAASYVIIGAGQAGRRAAETIKDLRPHADVLIIGDENFLPYDRPPLSKQVLFDEAEEKVAFIRSREFYKSVGIRLLLGRSAVTVDRAAHCVHLSDGSVVAFNKLLLATGSRARRLNCPIGNGAQVHYLRSLADARALRREMNNGRRIAILGGGFIGLEVAAAARSLNCEVTVIEPQERLLKRSLPAVVGSSIQRLHVSKGVRFLLGRTPLAVTTSAHHRGVVELDSGEVAADIVIAGVGSQPNTELAESAGLEVENGIVIDSCCRTADMDIFAAGDVTAHFSKFHGRRVRVEAWQVAEYQSVTAAKNMLGEEGEYDETPWLWSDQYDWNVQALGSFDMPGEIHSRGDSATNCFSVWNFGSKGEVLAVAAVNCGRDVSVARRFIKERTRIDPSKLEQRDVPIRECVASG
ncbi:NAD(P)/FAD-dependent oxidoreductase [Paraburkholderia terrae]|uniref:NAD(P)/FAD-dependent oxidoreductase n=1 Tax=Paraburkholderia terrae TaxID=311230 RepID=UPI001EE1EA51|nr:FAD-dependent oxidoreductase [Paraburkholderia terrae]GJH06776.1 FAD-dependent oxidoreductase [Paraburkholderia terrae]